MSNSKKGKRNLIKHQKKLEKKDKKSRRNYMRIANSKAFDIQLTDDGDTRTTLMIKNIPNKYTQDLLLQDIDQKFQNAYDFFYLPIDFDVSNFQNPFPWANFFRTNAMSDTHLSIWLSTSKSRTSIESIIIRSGRNSILRRWVFLIKFTISDFCRFARSNTPGFRVGKLIWNISRVPVWWSRT